MNNTLQEIDPTKVAVLDSLTPSYAGGLATAAAAEQPNDQESEGDLVSDETYFGNLGINTNWH